MSEKRSGADQLEIRHEWQGACKLFKNSRPFLQIFLEREGLFHLISRKWLFLEWKFARMFPKKDIFNWKGIQFCKAAK